MTKKNEPTRPKIPERALEDVPPEMQEAIRARLTRTADPQASAFRGPLVVGAGEVVAAATGLPTTSAEMAEIKRHARYDSIRAYRRAVDKLIHWALVGKIAPRAALDIAQTVKIGAEMLMSEHVLHAGGRVDQAPPHADGIDGGADLPVAAPRPDPEVRVERRVGIAPNGAPVDETSISLRSENAALATARPDIIGPALAELLRRRLTEADDETRDRIAQALGMRGEDINTLLNG
jgi:hypothetical protein